MAMLNNQRVNSMFGETPSTSLAKGTSEADLPTQTSGQLAMFEHMAPFFFEGTAAWGDSATIFWTSTNNGGFDG